MSDRTLKLNSPHHPRYRTPDRKLLSIFFPARRRLVSAMPLARSKIKSLALLLALLPLLVWADGIPVDRKTGKVTVPHTIISITPEQEQEVYPHIVIELPVGMKRTDAPFQKRLDVLQEAVEKVKFHLHINYQDK